MNATSLDWLDDAWRESLTQVLHGGAALAALDGRRSYIATSQGASGHPIDQSTSFHICSCSKMFVAAAFSRLVEDGAASWEEPAARIVPEFSLEDEALTQRVTFRDLAAMRVGLTREGVAEWGIRQELPKQVRLARARHMHLSGRFRSDFSYSNLCYIALGLAAERLSRRSLDALMREVVFEPADMKGALSSGFGSPPPADRAEPHLPIDGSARRVAELTGPNSEGSARVYLCARDAVKWMNWLIGAGAKSDGRGARALATIMTPQIPIDPADLRQAPEGGKAAYGMGLVITNFAGTQLFSHGGGGRGWRHMIAILPERRLGVTLMVAAESPRIDGIALDLLDKMAGLPSRHWADRFAEHALGMAKASQEKTNQVFPRGGKGDQAIDDMLGDYSNPVTGPVRVCREHGDIRLQLEDAPVFDGRLTPLGGNVHAIDFDEPALAAQPLDPLFRVKFARNGDAGVMHTSYFGDLRSSS